MWVNPVEVIAYGKVLDPTSTDPRTQVITYNTLNYNLHAIRYACRYAQRVETNASTNVTSALPGDSLQLIQLV